MRNLQGLSTDDLRRAAPSIFAEHAYEGSIQYGPEGSYISKGVSSKYRFVPTVSVIETLSQHGLVPVSAVESRTRIKDKQGYVKHSLRFRQAGSLGYLNEVTPEIVLTNSHDTGSSYIVELGLYRLVCANGLVASAGLFDAVRIRHMGIEMNEVLQATYSITKQFPTLLETVKKWQSVTLTQEQREELAARAVGLRWRTDDAKPFVNLLEVRREVDAGRSLWNTYNVIQENLIKGGVQVNYGRRARAVKAINLGLDINRGLWKMTEEYAGV